MRIYTRTGDKGTSALFNNTRRAKDDDVFEALGTTDELSSQLGFARSQIPSGQEWAAGLDAQLGTIQSLLQDAGGHLATPRNEAQSTDARIARTEFDPEGQYAAKLEQWIDSMDDSLEPLTAFILPGGGPLAASLHVSRSVCRRAERRAVPLVESGQAEPAVSRFLNRLSDYLFTAARFSAAQQGIPDLKYSVTKF